MNYQDEFVVALNQMISGAGSQKVYAEHVGIAQSRISEYLNSKITLDGISFGMILRLFPNIKISFTGDDETPVASDSKLMEDELLSLFRVMGAKDKARCLLIIGAHFSDIIKS